MRASLTDRHICCSSACRYVAAQVVSVGPLGILGQNGWFCTEADVARWHILTGWRGLNDGVVKEHFNNTFIAFYESWGCDLLLVCSRCS
jgi:hypothetical protein